MSFFTPQDLITISFLIFLEGILSIDNALVLAVLARGLPPEQQRRALTYGLVGAVVFRLMAIGLAAHLMTLNWVKFAGGGYLIFLAAKHFLKKPETPEEISKKPANSFWKAVVLIELTDIAFAVDSILAAVALSNKYWVVFTGGILGVVLMRFAASMFLGLLEKFPFFETTAYLLVLIIGTKVFVEGLRLPGVDFHSSSSPYFWGFWALMLICVLLGFRRPPKDAKKV